MRRLMMLLAVLALGALVLAANDTDLSPGRLVLHSSYGSTVSCSTATGDGSVCAEGDLEAEDDVDVGDALTVGGAATVGSTLTVTSSVTSSSSQYVVTQADLAATCTVGELKLDTGGATKELCYCQATNTWYCISFTTTSGPTD